MHNIPSSAEVNIDVYDDKGRAMCSVRRAVSMSATDTRAEKGRKINTTAADAEEAARKGSGLA